MRPLIHHRNHTHRAPMLACLHVVVLLIASAITAKAQQPDTLLAPRLTRTSELRLSLKYTSDYVYMGRADSLVAPYLSPGITYLHKSGMFIGGSLSYLLRSHDHRIDVYRIQVGYEKYHGNFAMGARIAQYFFNGDSYVVPSEMQTVLRGFAEYDFGPLTGRLDAGVSLGGATDLITGLELHRVFFFPMANLGLMPFAGINGGTQGYLEAYHSERGAKGSGKPGHGGTPPQTGMVQVLESNQWKILDMETGFQFVYYLGRLRVFGSALLAFPFNPSDILRDQSIVKEDLNTQFVSTVGLRIAI